jgi:hypothetical protein
MPTVVQFRRGSTAQNNAFTGAVGELSVDTTLGTIRVHNGVAGGNTLASIDAVQTLSNKTLSAPTITGTLSSTGFINTTGNILSTGLSVFGNTRIGSLAVPGALHTIIGNVDVSGAGTEYFNIGGNIMAVQASFGSINSTGLINTTGNIICASISAGTYVGLSSSKINTNASNVTVDSSYVNVAINGSNIASIGAAGIMPTANASGSLGSTTVRWNNIVGVSGNFLSVNANYADLAENYTSDQQYLPGTVLVFGGEAEVTQSATSHDTRIAGIVSTNPAYLMNHDAIGVPVALQGRVPCRVLGPVSKGDRVVSSHIAGVAQALDPAQYQPGCIIGKALQAIDNTDISIIEVVVGRL